MDNIEIERKFKVKVLPDDLEQYECKIIEQVYLNTEPVIRVRKENDTYYFSYKSGAYPNTEEYNLPLDKASYLHLKAKADGNVISKKRYVIPFSGVDLSGQYGGDNNSNSTSVSGLTIELDIFDPPFAPLVIAEVEFPDLETAYRFIPPDWFGEEVTMDNEYRNSSMSRRVFD